MSVQVHLCVAFSSYNNSSIAVSVGAYVLWMVVLPKLGGYAIRQVVEHLSDGAQNLKVVRVPLNEVEEWDTRHAVAEAS